jgi:hypothetical protein
MAAIAAAAGGAEGSSGEAEQAAAGQPPPPPPELPNDELALPPAEAAARVQAAFRGHMVRRRLRAAREQGRDSAVLLQVGAGR